MKKLIWIVVIIVVRGGLFLFMKKSQAPETMDMDTGAETATQPAGTPLEDNGMVGGDAVAPNTKVFNIDAGNFYFTPKTLSVKEGDTVELHVKNSGGMHDLRIDEFGVKTKMLTSGQEDVVTFVANKKGTFEYYCSVGTHRQMGMAGTLTVE